ncbi:hypothetical protein KVP10_15010 [Candidimonas humi]|uniref:Murein biosynthesis integral membrane protein MurJ n=1 Tax=Candidimonas humi TaxID=683355 RepID=A0ABV8P422_9BURK|nr:lipid II flippase MurJ [Candidimonas humi]MBV6306201.1 hypothetical protein [Candidimonas humi]
MNTFIRRLSNLHSDHRRIAQGAARVAFFLLLGKAAGALKEMAVAYRYGVSSVVDAYQFTMTMANWLPVTLVGVLSVVLIPVLVRIRYQDPAARARFLRELQAWVLVLGAVLAVLIYAAWPWVLSVAGKGLSPEVRDMSSQLMLAFAPAALLTVMTGVSAARLRSHERHINTLLDSVPAMLILLCILAWPVRDVRPLLWGTLLGYLLQSAWQLWLASKADGMWGRPQLTLRSPHWPDLAAAAGVMLVGQVAMSFVGPIDQYTAANLGANANATLGYAARLLSLVLGLGAASVGRAALPVLSDIQGRGDPVRARATALKWSGMMVLAGAVVCLIGWLLAPWGVALLFQRGAFTAQNTATVAQVLRWGLLQLPFYFGVLMLVQLLASQNRYRIMAAIAVANFALKAVMNHVLAPRMGVEGIMLATSIMYVLSYVCYVVAAWASSPAAARSRP